MNHVQSPIMAGESVRFAPPSPLWRIVSALGLVGVGVVIGHYFL